MPIFLVACGGGDGSGPAVGGNGNIIPSNYVEATSDCKANPFNVSYFRLANDPGSPQDIMFFSTLAQCQNNPSGYCRISSINASCHGIYRDLATSLPHTVPGSVWIYQN